LNDAYWAVQQTAAAASGDRVDTTKAHDKVGDTNKT